MTVWRVPSAGGASCVSTTGVTQSSLWGTVQSSAQTCLCPKCLTPPTLSETLAEQIKNASVVDTYFGGSAFDGSYALECITGYKAVGTFQCTVDSTNVYVGKFGTEPTCEPDDCRGPADGDEREGGHRLRGPPRHRVRGDVRPRLRA